LIKRGTQNFYPPEQRDWSEYWQEPIEDYRSPKYKQTERHMVWGVGKIMHDIIKLAQPQDADESMDEIDEADY
jgi:hypothetical protein